MHRHCRMSGAGARISLLRYLLHCFPTELTHTTDSMASMLKPNSKRPPPVVRKSMVQGAVDNSKTPLYGMDKELAERQAAKFDVTLQHQCQSWLEELTGSPLPDPDDFMGSLKDGSILCKAMNVIQPKSIKKIQTSKMPFKQMEKVSAFIKACRTYGIPEYQLFTTVDLFEAKDPNSVVQTIQALGGVAKKKGFAGPTIGVAQTSGGEKRSSKWENAIGKGGGTTFMTSGSVGAAGNQRDATNFVTGPTFGAHHAGTGDNSSVSQMNAGATGAGSARTAPVYSSYGITAGATAGKKVLKPAPPPPVPAKSSAAPLIMLRALYDFTATDTDEMSLAVGDVLETKEITAEWTEGTNIRTKQSGLFPTSYIEKMK